MNKSIYINVQKNRHVIFLPVTNRRSNITTCHFARFNVIIFRFNLLDDIYFVHGDCQLVPTCIGTVCKYMYLPQSQTISMRMFSGCLQTSVVCSS